MKAIIFALIALLGLLPVQWDSNDNSLKQNMDNCDFTPKPFVFGPGSKLYSWSNISLWYTVITPDFKVYKDLQMKTYDMMSECADGEIGDLDFYAKFKINGTENVLCLVSYTVVEIFGSMLVVSTPQGDVLDILDVSLGAAGMNLRQFRIDEADNIYVYTFIPEEAQSFPIEYCAVPPFKTFKGKVKEAVYTISGNRFILKEATYSETKYFTCKRKFNELPNLWDL